MSILQATKAVRYTGISSYCSILLILFLLYYLQVHGLNTEFTVAPIYGIFNITEINDSERYISMCSGVLFCSWTLARVFSCSFFIIMASSSQTLPLLPKPNGKSELWNYFGLNELNFNFNYWNSNNQKIIDLLKGI